jgi:transcription antitermination factor NusG
MKNKEKWYVIYTKSRHEKVLSDKLELMGYETFLPMIKSESLRKDRKKIIEKPLFNSYLFIKETIDLEPLRAFSSFVSYLQYNGKPAVVYQYEIDIIKTVIQYGFDVELNNQNEKPLKEGSRVLVIGGHLKGLEGELSKIDTSEWVTVFFENFSGSIRVKLPAKNLKVIED